MCLIPWNYFQSKYIKAFARFLIHAKIYWRRIHKHTTQPPPPPPTAPPPPHIQNIHVYLRVQHAEWAAYMYIEHCTCLRMHAMPKDIYLLIYAKLQVFGRFEYFEERERERSKYFRWIFFLLLFIIFFVECIS